MDKFRLDALTIILINAIIPLMCAIFPSQKMVVFTYILASSILILSGKRGRILKVMGFLGVFLMVYIANEHYAISAFLSAWCRMMLLFMPCLMLAVVLIGGYRSSEILSALQRLKLPKIFVIGITVTIRYIPTFYREFKIIKKAMKIRGLDFSILHPIRTFEYLMVPQLFRCVALSTELTCAGLTKGISAKNKRTSYFKSGFGVVDYVIFCILILGYVLLIGGII